MNSIRKTAAILLLLLATLLFSGCGTLRHSTPPELPPILGEDEILQPYSKLGRIQVTREIYGVADYVLSPDIRAWGFRVVREEAAKMGADAVISPEVTGRTTTFLSMPSTEYRATGVAIKFK